VKASDFTVVAPGILGLLLALAPHVLDPAEGPDLPGFSAAGARAQREAESLLVAELKASSLDAFHAELTRKPHMAGTEESRLVAEAIRRRLEEFGFETETRRYEAYLSHPKRIAVRRTAPSALAMRVDEPPEPSDPDTTQAGLTPGFVAYSASGRAEGPVVYANYGLPADYDALEAKGVSAGGTVALVRYGKVHRAVKVATAEARGARAVLIYSDPADDGFAKGEVMPKGPWRSEHLLQRGNAKLSWFFHGDPLTPGRPALPTAERLRPEEAPTLPRIPVAVLSWNAARPLLDGLAGTAPEGFTGGLDLRYGTGPGPVRAEVDVEMEAGLRPVFDVIARWRGREEPEREVLLGTHHDAWTFGGVDPGSSAATILELCRALGELKRSGFSPRRSIVVAFWDAEEPGLIGSTEYAEDLTAELRARAVAYVNSDLYLAGPLRAGGPPALQDFARGVFRDVRDPGSGSLGLPGASTVELQPLGSGADFVAFQDYLGLPTLSLELGAGTSYGAYHSTRDTRHYMKTHADPGWRHGMTLAELLGRTVLRLAHAESVPVRPSREAEAIGHWLDRLEERQGRSALGDVSPLRQALRAYGEDAARVEADAEAALRAGETARAARAGDLLLSSLKAFVDDADPQFYRHPIYGWDIHALYGGDTLPGLGRAAREGDPAAVAFERGRIESAVGRARAALARADAPERTDAPARTDGPRAAAP
jgi:N-acetylated-alpha-linked acidic dipeptidase